MSNYQIGKELIQQHRMLDNTKASVLSPTVSYSGTGTTSLARITESFFYLVVISVTIYLVVHATVYAVYKIHYNFKLPRHLTESKGHNNAPHTVDEESSISGTPRQPQSNESFSDFRPQNRNSFSPKPTTRIMAKSQVFAKKAAKYLYPLQQASYESLRLPTNDPKSPAFDNISPSKAIYA